ncbi:ATP-binding protein [Halorubrum aethiopicum]|uniref:ATP-binding protein n=1 Tax=Halorubrum aethiopicum TaxID=1758255 RepID=UPI0009B5BED4|nr:ATP-binding protein [Halorubrum aethiopicum]
MGVATNPSELVVLVEQSGNLSRRLKTALVTDGYEVTTVDTASECIRLAEQRSVAGVVSEYALPDFDGVNLLRSIRISNPTLPFILVPTEGSESIAGEAIAAGVSGYVPQADDTKTVLSRIRADIDNRNSSLDEESHHRYQRLVQMAPAPINIFDEAGTTIWGNDAVVELLGLESRYELVGRSIFEFIHPDDRPVARQELETVIDEKDSVGPTAMKLLRPDDQVRHIQVATAIGSYLGGDIGQAIILDVTEREEFARQLAVLSTWLRHNIRNEMNIVHGIAGELREENVPRVGESATAIQAHVEHLVDQADRGQEMVELLVGKPPLVSLSVTSAIDDQIQTKQTEYPHAEIDGVQEATVEIEATPQFPKAIGELIENAIEHNDTETPHVQVELERPDQTTIGIRVRDDGPGIPAVEKELLRLEQPIDQLNHGSGLGLLFVHSVVTQSDGSLRFGENKPRGSVVTVTVPTELDN